MRTIGLDIGERTIGVAVSDELGITAQPLTTIKRTSIKKDIERIRHFIEEYSSDELVVGMPFNMDGSTGRASEQISSLVRHLQEKTSVTVTLWDERLSTVAVTRVLLEGDVRRKRRKEVVDKLAASFILQGYLDHIRNHRDGM